MRFDSYNGTAEKPVHYTDRIDLKGRIVFFDLIDRDRINSIAADSVDWLDFITGCRQNRFEVVCNPNGSYNVQKGD